MPTTPIWPIEGVAVDSTGDMVPDSLAYKVADLASHINAVGYIYPTLAAGAPIVSSAVAWTLGSFATIVPINTITNIYHIHSIAIESVTADGVYELVLYQGAADVEISRIRFAVIGGFWGNAVYPITCARIAANDGVRGKVARGTAGAATVTISVIYAQDLP